MKNRIGNIICKKLLILSLPLIISHIGIYIVQVADTYMVGIIGKTELAAVSFASNIYFLIYIIIYGLTYGITPIVGELYKKNRRNIGTLLYSYLFFFGIISFVAFILQLSIIRIFPYLGQPIHILKYAIPYYIYMSLSTIPLILFSVFKQILDGMGKTWLPMVVIILSNILNIIFDYILINGKYGFPSLGCTGAGVATLLTRCIMLIIIILVVFYTKELKEYMFGVSSPVHLSYSAIKYLIRFSIPIASQMSIEGYLFAITGVFMGFWGECVLAANQIVITIANFPFMVITSFGTSVSIFTSQSIGRKKYNRISLIIRLSYVLMAIWNVLTIIIFLVLGEKIGKVFCVDKDVLDWVSYFLLIVSSYQLSDGFQCLSTFILRSFKDVYHSFRISFLSYITSFLTGCTIAFIWNSPTGIYLGYCIGLSLSAFLLTKNINYYYQILRSGKYIPQIS